MIDGHFLLSSDLSLLVFSSPCCPSYFYLAFSMYLFFAPGFFFVSL